MNLARGETPSDADLSFLLQAFDDVRSQLQRLAAALDYPTSLDGWPDPRLNEVAEAWQKLKPLRDAFVVMQYDREQDAP